jgi:aryl-alcohol dehydrogenase-like predicted oxidoreductase
MSSEILKKSSMRLGLGCWAIGGPFWAGDQPLGWGEVEDRESIRAVRAALDAGLTLFDTADVYGAGHSERILGQALGKDRSKAVICTKWGNRFDEGSRQLTGTDSAPTYVREACTASLRRLGTDYIDVYQLHIGDLPLEQLPPIVQVLEELVEEGKIRSYAWSTDDQQRAATILQRGNASGIQFEMNVLNDAPELVQLLADTSKMGLIRGPLAMGLLSGKYQQNTTTGVDDVRTKVPAWMKYFRDGKPVAAYQQRLESVRHLLTTDGRSLVQSALAWLWSRSPNVVPIPGFRTEAQVRELIGAWQFPGFSQEEMKAVAAALV